MEIEVYRKVNKTSPVLVPGNSISSRDDRQLWRCRMWRHPEIQPWANGAQRLAIGAVGYKRRHSDRRELWQAYRQWRLWPVSRCCRRPYWLSIGPARHHDCLGAQTHARAHPEEKTLYRASQHPTVPRFSEPRRHQPGAELRPPESSPETAPRLSVEWDAALAANGSRQPTRKNRRRLRPRAEDSANLDNKPASPSSEQREPAAHDLQPAPPARRCTTEESASRLHN